ncbi:MAG: hypothetical protein ACTSVV_02000 [Promethearchaeota archaeon]
MKHIIILTSNIDYFTLLCKKFPYSISDLNLHVIVDDRYCTFFENIKHISIDGYETFCYLGKEIMNEVFDIVEIEKNFTEFFWKYKLSLKLALFIYFGIRFSKFLYLDDDVVCLKDPSIYWTYDYACAKDAFFKFSKNSEASIKEFNEFMDVVNADNLSIDEYNIMGTYNTGVMVWTHDNEWIEINKRFYKSNFFLNVFNNYKNEKSFINRLFILEQKLVNFFLKTKKKKVYILRSKDCKIWNAKFIKFKKKDVIKAPVFIHYAAGIWKKDYVNYLNNVKIIM